MLASKKINEYEIFKYIDILIFFSAIFCFLFVNDVDNIKYIGLVLILCSVEMLIKVKDDRILLLLFAIILYVNFSLALEDLGLTKSTIIIRYQRQFALRDTYVNVVASKCMLLLNCIVNYLLPMTKYRDGNRKAEIEFKDNSIIFYCGYVVMLYGLIFGFERYDRSAYESNSNAIYEYCLIIFIVIWYYSGNKKNNKILLLLYSCAYILQGFVYGDRSSMFPMCILVVILLFKELKIRTMAIFAVVGVFATNFIAIYRSGFVVPSIGQVIQRGIKADTLTSSYYTSLTVIKTKEFISDSTGDFVDFFITIFKGGEYGNSNVTKLASKFVYNSGGGMYYSYYYYWLGYIGVAIGALILAYIIRMIIKKDSEYFRLLKVCLVTMSFRWYIYTPTVFLRSTLLIFSVLFFVCKIFDNITKNK